MRAVPRDTLEKNAGAERVTPHRTDQTVTPHRTDRTVTPHRTDAFEKTASLRGKEPHRETL